MKPIIEIDRLGKKYKIGAHKEPYLSLRGELAKTGRRLASVFSQRRPGSGGKEQSSTDFWALKDVSLAVLQGEAVGIIGRNGAGKSTLLKILSMITPPTEGEIICRGRIASLLEVGTGFHPELTGRENIFLNGAILGMTRAEIRRKFDEIVAFAEIDKFIDTPVKRYSSGMYVRLAFAVAAHLEPEILVVDEVLAVGDAEFQKKCLGKMGDVARGGRTVLFVSHNMQAMKVLCQRGILLQNGRSILDTSAESAAECYLAQGLDTNSAEKIWKRDQVLGDETFNLRAVRLVDINGQVKQEYESGKPVFIQIEFDLFAQNATLRVGFDLVSMDGNIIIQSFHNDGSEGDWPTLVTGRNLLQCEIPPHLLTAGRYGIAPAIGLHKIRWIFHEGTVVKFDVQLTHTGSPFWTHKKPGLLSPVWNWRALECFPGEKSKKE